MTTDIIQYASIAGELSQNLWGRTDFEKYDSAWARAHNWLVDYRGGLFTRPGFAFGDLIEWTKGEAVKFVNFQYAPDTANTYLCIFTDDKVRFAQDNAYVLEAEKTVASVAVGVGNKLTITANSHGYSDGDWVKLSGFTAATLLFLNNRTIEVANKTTNTFDITNPITGSLITKAGAATGTGSAYRIYTIVSPYGQEDLARLQAVQIRDYVRLTHPDYPIKNLIRAGETSWSISDEVIGRAVSTVTGLASTTSTDENDVFVYQVTAVDENGEEGLPDIDIETDGPNMMDTGSRYINLTWTKVTGALYYNVYRSRALGNAGANYQSDATVGYVGRATGTAFTDPGITPDFTKQPPQGQNPFANGRIKYITVTTQGTGYSYDSTINWPSGGSGAYGFISTRTSSSPVYGIKVLNGGEGYTGTAVTAGTGSSFVGVATLSPASGNYPRCCSIFQQRMIYAATDNDPLRIFGSRPGQLSNFDVSELGSDADAYEFDIDTDLVAPIRHLFPVRGGLLAFNEMGVWLIAGRNNSALTANNAQSDIQNALGANFTRPIYVDAYVLYGTAAGQEIHMLVYDDYAKAFGDQNVSLLANHLFEPGIEIKSMAYCPIPSKVVYAVQSNGRLIATTIDVANEVYACTPQWTQGLFRECSSVLEENESRLYVAVERRIGSNTILTFERQVSRDFDTIEDAFCLDMGLELDRTYPSGELIPSTATGAVTFTASGASPFVVGDVGKIIRAGTGRATVTGYTSATSVDGTWTRDLEDTEPESTSPKRFESGTWTLDSASTVLRGLWMHEGETVSVVADGTVLASAAVSDASITLPGAVSASRIVVGRTYTCIAQTLPPTAANLPIEARRKDIVGLGLNIYKTASLKYGSTLTNLYAVADRTQRLWSRANRLRTEVIHEIPVADWGRYSQLYLVQNEPLPAAILSFIRDVDIGDDKE